MTKSADLQRLASLSYCIFAVAMTLLTFSVRIPDHGVDPAKLPGELTRMWNESFGLVLSFAIAAMFWVGHFHLLRSLSRATIGLIYLNLFQLFWIAVLPISTSLWIRTGARETTIILEANLTLIALSALLMWVYASRNGLIEPGGLTHPIAVESISTVFPLLIFAISLLVTFWNPTLGGKLLWGAFATPFSRPPGSNCSLCGENEGEQIDGTCSNARRDRRYVHDPKSYKFDHFDVTVDAKRPAWRVDYFFRAKNAFVPSSKNNYYFYVRNGQVIDMEESDFR